MRRSKHLLLMIAGGLVLATFVVVTAIGISTKRSDAAKALGSQLLSTGPSASVASVGPDTEYHLVERLYRRYGAGAPEIQANPGNGPETQVSESVIVFDHAGMESSLTVNVADETGTLLQQTRLDNGQFINTNIVTGTRMVLAGTPQTADQFKQARVQMSQSWARSLSAGTVTVVQRDDQVIVLKQSASLPGIRDSAGKELDQGFTIPYVRDLHAASAYTLISLDASSLALVKTQMFVVGKDGVTTLVEERDIVAEATRQIGG